MTQTIHTGTTREVHTSVVLRKQIGPNLRVMVLGKEDGINWSLSDYQGDTLSGDGVRELFAKQQETLAALGITGALYSPRMARDKVTFRRFNKNGFIDSYSLDRTLSICKSSNGHCNALNIPMETQVAMPVADCPAVIFRDKVTGEVVMAHCGRDNLMCWDGKDPAEGDRPSSVIDSVVDYFVQQRHRRAWDIEAYTFCSIGARFFQHPTDRGGYKTQNQRMVNYLKGRGWQTCLEGEERHGCLDLRRLIGFQCADRGIPVTIHADEDTDTYGDSREWSHREWEDQKATGDPTFPDGRNLVVAQHSADLT